MPFDVDLASYIWPDVAQGRQPQGAGYDLDRKAQASIGLVFLWSAAASDRDLVTMQRSTGSSGTGPIKIGISNFGFSGSGNNNNQASYFQAPTTGPSYTVFCLVLDQSPQSSSTETYFYSDSTNGASTRVFIFRGKPYGHQIEFIPFDTSGNPYFADGPSNVANTLQLLVGTVDKAGNSISWINGVGSSPVAISGTPQGLVKGRDQLGISTTYTTQLLMCGIYNRALSASEQLSLLNAPWQLLAPPQSLRFKNSVSYSYVNGLYLSNGVLSQVSGGTNPLVWDGLQIKQRSTTEGTPIVLDTGALRLLKSNEQLTTAVTVPGAPTGVTATSGNHSASVAFTAPSSNGGGAISGYTATSSPGGITASASTSPIAVAGLTNNTAYTFTVHATNSAGNGPESAPSNSVTPSGVAPP